MESSNPGVYNASRLKSTDETTEACKLSDKPITDWKPQPKLPKDWTFVNESINFHEVQCLILDLCTEQMRRVFMRENQLDSKSKVGTFLIEDKNKREVDFEDQESRVFSPDADIDKFDMTTLLLLLRLNHSKHKSFWINPPDDDNSELANIVRIYQYKKTVLDCSYSARLTDTEFANQLKKLTLMFRGIGVSDEDIRKYRKSWQRPKELQDISFISESKNFHQVQCLILDLCTEQMRRFFMKEGQLDRKSEVGIFVMEEKNKYSALREVDFDGQESKIFSPDADIDMFDMTTLLLLIRYCFNPDKDESFWKDPPHDDNSELANIVRIYQYKQTVLDCSCAARITDEDFTHHWKNLISLLTGIGVPLEDIERYRNSWLPVKELQESSHSYSGMFNETGGHLKLKAPGIELTIPPFALGPGYNKIHIEHISDEEIGLPEPGPMEMRVGPVVSCEPSGIVFMRPCTLSFPHNVADETSWQFTGIVRNHHFENWRRISDDDKDYRFYIKDGRCFFELKHFCWFSCFAMTEKLPMYLQLFGAVIGGDKTYYRIHVKIWSNESYQWLSEAVGNEVKISAVHPFVRPNNDVKLFIWGVSDEWKISGRVEQVIPRTLARHSSTSIFMLESEVVPKQLIAMIGLFDASDNSVLQEIRILETLRDTRELKKYNMEMVNLNSMKRSRMKFMESSRKKMIS